MSDSTRGWNAAGWLLVSPSAVPEEWQSRVIPMSLIPMLPAELAGHFQEDEDDPSGGDAALLGLVAHGVAKGQIARDLHISIRTLDRRLSRLRQEFGVRSLSELAGVAARRGFGSTQGPPEHNVRATR